MVNSIVRQEGLDSINMNFLMSILLSFSYLYHKALVMTFNLNDFIRVFTVPNVCKSLCSPSLSRGGREAQGSYLPRPVCLVYASPHQYPFSDLVRVFTWGIRTSQTRERAALLKGVQQKWGAEGWYGKRIQGRKIHNQRVDVQRKKNRAKRSREKVLKNYPSALIDSVCQAYTVVYIFCFILIFYKVSFSKPVFYCTLKSFFYHLP